MKTQRRVVDAHVHVIEHLAGIGRSGESRAIGRGSVRWIGGRQTKVIPDSWGETSFTHDTLIGVMDQHGVSQAVMMQGPFYGFCNDYTSEAQQRHRGRLFGMGSFDPFAFEAGAVMESLARDFGFRGLKFEVSRAYGLMGFHPDLRLDAAPLTAIWEFAEREDLVVSLDLGTFGEPSLQLEAMKTVASRHPGIRFVMEHLFAPGPGRFEDVRSALTLLAPRENVFFTLASLPGGGETYPFPSAGRYAGIARDVVGAARILWGSDLPSTAVNTSYRQLIDFVEESGLFSEEELRMIYAENATRVYRLDK